ncbi:putative transmembrane protein [Blattabacterium sp. (Blattella germanica) str. Bge]|uniref:diadenylate cyclase n=1 Tax=Blattabacterium sp. (Blattella germanica) TaxID=624186 RepID=UPI0001BB60BB|nr:diadenylate cyclase [Blattabacterium sp. (Blattella germanica)]ACY40133.1 putative transmembrane protein [Blattabacterium sp. (Blattella germanica) str. Bge]
MYESFFSLLYSLKISFIDILDRFLVSIILFQVYRLVYNTPALNIFYGIIATFIFWKIVEIYEMKLLSIVISAFFKGGFLALIIVFQPEIRKFLLIVGSRIFLKKFIFSLFFKKSSVSIKTETIDSIVKSCAIFSGDKTGVLIVIQLHQDLKEFIQNGDKMDAKVNIPILESIFYKNSPLHDGAVVVIGNKIVRTRAILPVSYNKEIPSRLGLRHRAAIGLSEKTDAICLVISEETGYISYIKDQKRTVITNINNLKMKLEEDLL